MNFDEILDAIDNLDDDEYIEISRIINNRAIERARATLSEEIKVADDEFKSGKLQVQSVREIMDELEQ